MSESEPGISIRRSTRRKWIVIAVLAACWLAGLALRWEIRTRWWAYRLAQVETPEERAYYFASLASVPDRAVGVAAGLLEHPAAEVRLAAVGVLNRARGERVRNLLSRALSDPDADVREAAALGLALHHEAAALPTLVEMVHSTAEPAALAAAFALERVGGPDAVDALIRAAGGHPSLAVRAQAVDSLGLLGNKAAVPLLIECLRDERPLASRTAADRALERAVGALGTNLESLGVMPEGGAVAPPTLADLAARALHRITGEAFGFRTNDPPERKANVIRLYEQWWAQHKGS
ncbi:MAG: HEAT repeat domain-containing protein [Phycisphaerae bacterium]|nr:HEAT repeat domain-containing protein [Phycisphaerae bacterium]